MNPVMHMAEALELAEGADGPAPMDQGRFGAFYTRTAGPLRRYLWRIGGGLGPVDDLVQEAYCRFLAKSRHTGDESQQVAYLYRIATHLVIDLRRRSGRELELTIEPAAKQQAADPDVGRLFGQLEPRERALLWLAYVEGCDHHEIAARLGVRTLSVRVMLFRARRRFAGILEKGGFA